MDVTLPFVQVFPVNLFHFKGCKAIRGIIELWFFGAPFEAFCCFNRLALGSNALLALELIKEYKRGFNSFVL